MEELIALVKLFKTMPGNARARLLGNGQDKLKVMYDFMENINCGKFTSDEDASKHYFNSTPKNTKYYSLKKRLRDKLLAWILNTENPYLKYEELEYAIISLHRLSAQAGILNSIGVYGSANKINMNILKIAAKFDLTEFGEKAARNVRDFYALRELNLSKFNFYNTLLEKLYAENTVEHLADELYASFMVVFHSNKKNRSILGNIVTKYILQFEKLLLINDSEKIKQLISKINILALISEKEFQSALYKVSANLVDLEKTPYQQNVLKNELIQQKMVCYLNLKQFDEGKKVAEDLVFMHTTPSEITLENEEINFLLSLHGQHYNEAAGVWLNVSNKGLLKNVHGIIREKWETYKIYLYFLHSTGEISIDFSKTLFKGFRQAKFFNTVPILNKDKAGMNVSILAIEYILYLTQGKFDKITDKYEAMFKYSYRYLRDEESLRSYNFFRLLLLIPNCAYNWKTISERGEQMLRKITSHPNIESSIKSGAEIIPYDVLWNLINKHTAHRNFKF